MALRSRGVMCQTCGHRAVVREGGGRGLYLLHCERCGEAKLLTRDDVREPHLRYLKGLPESGRELTADYDKAAVDACPGEPLSLEGFLAAVEAAAGTCACGGAYSLEAPPRCPQCHSADLTDDPDGPGIVYD